MIIYYLPYDFCTNIQGGHFLTAPLQTLIFPRVFNERLAHSLVPCCKECGAIFIDACWRSRPERAPFWTFKILSLHTCNLINIIILNFSDHFVYFCIKLTKISWWRRASSDRKVSSVLFSSILNTLEKWQDILNPL